MKPKRSFAPQVYDRKTYLLREKFDARLFEDVDPCTGVVRSADTFAAMGTIMMHVEALWVL